MRVYKLLGLLLVSALVVSVLFVLFGTDNTEPPADRNPAAYFYLNSAKTDEYLGQLRGGTSTTREVTDATKRNVSAEFKKGIGNLGAEFEGSSSSTSTVKSTPSHRFYDLENRLEDGGGDRQLVHVDAQDDQACAALRRARDGDFLRLKNVRLAAPSFVLPIPGMAHSDQFLVTTSETAESPSVDQTRVAVGRGRRSLARLADPPYANPVRDYVEHIAKRTPAHQLLVPMRAAVPSSETSSARSDDPACQRILIPLLHASLINGPTGRVTVVGKLIERDHFDRGIQGMYLPALQKASPSLRQVLAIPPGAAGVVINAAVRAHVVIDPVAIYD